MARNYTENYGLCQWEATDQVLRTEFNEDNAKIDAALEGLKSICNCQFHLQSYTGTGERGPVQFTFPLRPIFVIIIGENDTLVSAIQGMNQLYGQRTSNLYFDTPVIWTDRAITLGTSITLPEYCCNSEGMHYRIMAILDVVS